MPEWNIQRISRFTAPYYRNSSDDKKYYITPHDETWDAFVLNNKTVRCKVSRLLNSKGEIMMSIGEEFDFPCRIVESAYSIESYNRPNYSKTNTMILPDEFVKSFGIRDGDYIDLTLIGIVDNNKKLVVEIFPKRKVNGIISIHPSSDREIPTLRNVDNLIEPSMSDEFFAKLIQEINDAYAYELYRATHVLLRTLFENLILKLLKAKFPKEKELYLNKKDNFLEFSKLIDNFKERKHEFAPYARLFDDDLFSFLDKFRETANVSVHILEVYLDKEKIDKDKQRMNQYIKIINSVIEDIKS